MTRRGARGALVAFFGTERRFAHAGPRALAKARVDGASEGACGRKVEGSRVRRRPSCLIFDILAQVRWGYERERFLFGEGVRQKAKPLFGAARFPKIKLGPSATKPLKFI